MRIISIDHTNTITTVDNCSSGKCGPPRYRNIVNDKINAKVEISNGVTVDVQLSQDEISYFREIIYAKAKEKLSTLNVEATI